MESNISFEDIKSIIDLKIDTFKAEIVKQFKTITAQPISSEIEISDSGTRVEFFSKKDIKSGIVEIKEGYKLYIGKKELMTMINTRNDISIHDSFMKLISHEYLHILYEDFSHAKLNAVYNFNLGSAKPKDVSDIYFEKTNEKRDSFGYKKIDRKIMNIAADLVINQDIDIRYPFLVPETYNLPKYLTVHEYYKILYSVKESKDENSLSIRSIGLTEEDKERIKKLINEYDSSEIDSLIKDIEENSFSPIIANKRNKNSIKLKKKKEIDRLNSISIGNVGYLEYD